eukprot:7378374-Prymnesium_polylepis.2
MIEHDHQPPQSRPFIAQLPPPVGQPRHSLPGSSVSSHWWSSTPVSDSLLLATAVAKRVLSASTTGAPGSHGGGAIGGCDGGGGGGAGGAGGYGGSFGGGGDGGIS